MAQHPQLRSLEPYEHLGNGEVAQPRYRLQGRIKSIRSAGSKLVFIDLIPVSSIERSGDGYGPFQAVLDFGILPEGESSDKMWRDFKRVARAGDWIGKRKAVRTWSETSNTQKALLGTLTELPGVSYRYLPCTFP